MDAQQAGKAFVAVDQLATDLGTENRIRLPDMTFWHGKSARGHGLMRRIHRSNRHGDAGRTVTGDR
jgi:hypothetical protein